MIVRPDERPCSFSPARQEKRHDPDHPRIELAAAFLVDGCRNIGRRGCGSLSRALGSLARALMEYRPELQAKAPTLSMNLITEMGFDT